MDWKYLMQLLVAFRFPSKAVDWIRECVCKFRYSLVINGDQVGYIDGKNVCGKVTCYHLYCL